MFRKSPVLADLERVRKNAAEALERTTDVKNKVAALDTLDRLALNPSGWLPERTLDRLTTARRKILVNHWPEATEALEDVRAAMLEFSRALKAGEGGPDHPNLEEALKRAEQELLACVAVLGWIDRQPPG